MTMKIQRQPGAQGNKRKWVRSRRKNNTQQKLTQGHLRHWSHRLQIIQPCLQCLKKCDFGNICGKQKPIKRDRWFEEESERMSRNTKITKLEIQTTEIYLTADGTQPEELWTRRNTNKIIHNSAQRDKKKIRKNTKERLRGVRRSSMQSIKVPREKIQNGVMMVKWTWLSLERNPQQSRG